MTLSATGDVPGRSRGDRKAPTHWAFRPATFLVAMALLQILHAILRPLLTDTVGNDNTDQLFFAQDLRAGYAYEQLPLYTWIVWSVGQLLGPTIVAVGIIRYSLVFLIHLFAYLSGRRLFADPRLQVACGLSPLLLYPIGWRLHEADTLGVLASVLILALTWVLIRVLQRGGLADFLGFGLVLGLGLLSSGYFGIGVVALLLAVLIDPIARRGFFRWPLLPALLLSGLILLPTLLWALGQGGAMLDQIQVRLAEWQDADALNPWYDRAWFGFINLFVGNFPAWLILGLLFFPSLRPLPRGSLTGAGRVLLLYSGLILVLTPLTALLLEVHNTHQFRLYPLTLPLLPLFFLRLSLRPLHPTPLRWLLILYAVFILAAIQGRFQHIEAGPAFCAQCRMQTPYPDMATTLRAEGYAGGGTIVAGDIHIAGNLRTQFPEARILTPRYPEVRPPAASEAGACVVVWNAREGRGHVERLYRFVEDLGVTLPSVEQSQLTVLKIPLPPRIDVPQREVPLRSFFLPSGQGHCR
ncbi:MAG: glycosyltransferase family 39 protein [Rhodospirillales bacterium]